MTFSCISQDYCMTFHDFLAFLKLSHTFLILFFYFSWLSNDLLLTFFITFLLLFHYCLVIFLWLSHDFLINFSLLSHDFIMIFLCLSCDFLMTSMKWSLKGQSDSRQTDLFPLNQNEITKFFEQFCRGAKWYNSTIPSMIRELNKYYKENNNQVLFFTKSGQEISVWLVWIPL